MKSRSIIPPDNVKIDGRLDDVKENILKRASLLGGSDGTLERPDTGAMAAIAESGRRSKCDSVMGASER